METVELATAYLSLVPTLKGAQGKIAEEVGVAGQPAGEKLGGGIVTGLKGALGPVAGIMAGVFGVKAIADWGKEQIASLARIETINAQTAAAIESTGGAANVSAKHVEDLAGELENLTATEAESVQQGANMLLTFKNIQNGVGEGNDIFDQATRSLVDMSRAMGSDPQTAAIQLGKALNDPIAGISALSRVGIQFTDDQKALIQSLVDSGQTMEAQKIILGELNSQFGGSGAAYAETYAGKITLLGHAWGTFGEQVFSVATPAIGAVASALTGLLNNVLTPFVASMQSGFGAIKAILFDGDYTGAAATFGLSEDSPAIAVLFAIRDAALTARDAVSLVVGSFTGVGADVDLGGWTNPLIDFGASLRSVYDSIGPLVGQVVELWSSFSPLSLVFQALQPVLPQLAAVFGQLAATLSGSLITALQSIYSALAPVVQILVGQLSQVLQTLIPVVAQVASTLGGALGAALTALAPVVASIAQALGGVLTTVLTALSPLISMIAGLLGQVLSAVLPLISPILGLVGALLPLLAPIIQLVGSLLEPLIKLLTALLQPILALITPLVDLLAGALGIVVQALSTVIEWIVQGITWLLKLVTGSEDAGDQFNAVWSAVAGFFADVWTGIAGFFEDTWNGIVAFFQPIIEWITAFIQVNAQIWSNVFLIFAAVTKTIWDAIVNAVTTAWNAISSFLTPAVSAITGFLIGAFSAVSDWWNGLWGGISKFFTDVWNGMLAIGVNVALAIYQAVSGPIQALADWWNGIWSSISGFFFGIWGAMVSAVSGAVGQIGSVVGGIWSTVMGALGNVGSWLVNAGADLVRGFWNGISNMASWLWKQVSGFFNNVIGWAKETLGIHSPSRVFRDEVGAQIGAGIALGLEDSSGLVETAMSHVLSVPDQSALAPTVNTFGDHTALAGDGYDAPGSIGDTFVFNGVTTDTAAEEIGEVIETKKRRKVRRTGAPVTGGVT